MRQTSPSVQGCESEHSVGAAQVRIFFFPLSLEDLVSTKLAPAFSSPSLLRDICARQSQGKLQDEDISLFANLSFYCGEGGGESREKKRTLFLFF